MKLRYWSRMLAGAVCAILASWLGLALFFYVLVFALWGSDALARSPILDSPWLFVPLLIVGGLLIVVVSFAVLSCAAGLICAFFWHPVATVSNYERWGFWVYLLALAPAILVYGLGLLVFLPSLVTFYKALDFGVKWWPNRGWRHLFDFANDWEREENQR